jgi:hypothetical protein
LSQLQQKEKPKTVFRVRSNSGFNWVCESGSHRESGSGSRHAEIVPQKQEKIKKLEEPVLPLPGFKKTYMTFLDQKNVNLSLDPEQDSAK